MAMNSLELLFALLALASFASFAVSEQKNFMDAWNGAAAVFTHKAAANECAALANQYYANAGGTLDANIECTINSGNAISANQISPAIPAALRAQRILVEVESHYGNQ